MKYPLLLILPLFFLSSCLTTGKSSSPAVQAAAPPVPKEERVYETRRDIRSVKDLPSWVYDSSPRDGAPRSVIFASRYANEDSAFQAAWGLAAIDAARRDGIYVTALSLSQEGSYNFAHASDIQIRFLTDNRVVYLDNLELENFLYTPVGTIARFSLVDADLPRDLDFTPDPGSPPQWITRIPQIEGYIATVGTAERHQDWGYSFEAADKSALANLTVSLYSKLTEITTTWESSRNDNNRISSLETLFIRGEGILRDTMIIARWVDEKEEQFYSLAVMPSPLEE